MSGLVYFLQAGEGGPIKIGWAKTDKTLKSRLSSHQCGNPVDLELIATVEGDRFLEGAFHRVCAASRTRERGEWFHATPLVLACAGLFTKAVAAEIREKGPSF